MNKELLEKIRKAEKVVEESIAKHVPEDKNYKRLKEEIEKLLYSSKHNVLVIYGRGGIGKSTAVRNILEEFREKEGFKYKIFTKRLEHLSNFIMQEDPEFKEFIKKLDFIVFDDSMISVRLQELLINLIDKYNKKIIFIANDIEDLRRIPKVVYNRGFSIEYDLEEDTLRKIVEDINNKLEINIKEVPFNLRILFKIVGDYIYSKEVGKETDVSYIMRKYVIEEIERSNSVKQMALNIGKYLMSTKKYNTSKELLEDIKRIFINILGYSENTINKKYNRVLKEVATYLKFMDEEAF